MIQLTCLSRFFQLLNIGISNVRPDRSSLKSICNFENKLEKNHLGGVLTVVCTQAEFGGQSRIFHIQRIHIGMHGRIF